MSKLLKFFIIVALLTAPVLADSPQRIDFENLSRELRQLEVTVAELREARGTDNAEYVTAYTKLCNLKDALRAHPWAEHVTLPPSAKVTARDGKSGKSETREAACRQPHGTYVRPDFRLTIPKLDIDPERQALLDTYRELEDRLAQHLVVCHVSWTQQKGRTALEWDNERRAIIDALLVTERNLALAYSGARDQTHYLSLAQAEGALLEAKELDAQAFAMEARFAELEELEKKYRIVCQAFNDSRTSHKLYKRFFLVHEMLIREMNEIRATQNQLGNDAHELRRLAVELKKAMDKRRLDKGVEEINIRLRQAGKELFRFHKAEDFNLSSELTQKMVGSQGIEIFTAESALRRAEIVRVFGPQR